MFWQDSSRFLFDSLVCESADRSLGVELLYKLIMGEEVDLGDENNFIDTSYEIVDKSNYEEIRATKTPW